MDIERTLSVNSNRKHVLLIYLACISSVVIKAVVNVVNSCFTQLEFISRNFVNCSTQTETH